MRRSFLPLFLALSLCACGQPSGADAPAGPDLESLSPLAQKGLTLFRECGVCHNYQKGGRHGVGPNLWGVVGAPAAQRDTFAYSRALERSGLIWTEDTLDRYLENPHEVVPGTRMAYRGMADPADRDALIAFLASLQDPPKLAPNDPASD
ncbi:cytochrome c, class I [Parvularcula bermudensis HTCC2503]|uniref:Cytochrome c, class I n=1 Tax=Parvularcula bermudensis (strain ATCC BAA-594 / HTCC2503 / KCTC 12087) TaxID=314260 RepID=E0TIB2_PARBH|nr:cytochrome c family protein [Parvularcula bermudensis]ADM09696.1 cytochrome c, class I [Parvularcula bermudensis HTCC2503]